MITWHLRVFVMIRLQKRKYESMTLLPIVQEHSAKKKKIEIR